MHSYWVKDIDRKIRRSFNCATNAIFGRIGRIVTEDVVLHLLQTKCIPLKTFIRLVI